MIGRVSIVALGVSATLGATAIYHGPVGAGERFATAIERVARSELDRQEMTQVQARLQRRPLRRTLVMSGPADDFQRSELVRIMSALPGVDLVGWDAAWLPAEKAQ